MFEKTNLSKQLMLQPGVSSVFCTHFSSTKYRQLITRWDYGTRSSSSVSFLNDISAP